MKRCRCNPLLAIVCIFIIHSQMAARSRPAEAEENPLSTVVHLLSTTEKNDNGEEKFCLAKSLASVDRFEEVLRALDMIERGSYVEANFFGIVQQLIERGKENEASTLVTYLLDRFAGDGYRLRGVIRPMVLLKRDDELLTLIEKLGESEQLELWFRASDIYRETGKPEKALAVLEKTVKVAMASEYPEDRAKLALGYARLGREAEAVELVQSISRELDPKTRNIDVVFNLAEAYRVLGKYSDADQLERIYNDGLNIDETRDIVSTASRLVINGERQKALDTLAQALTRLDPKEYGDSFYLGNIIEIYLQIAEIQKAEQVAKSITGSDYMQQRQLLAVADRYVKAGNKTKVREFLRFALQQTYRIDTSGVESGSLSTSSKWEQAQYQSQIAIRYMELRDDKEALRITSELRKPYLRALILTDYVAINKNRITSKKLAHHLDEALVLLRQKKSDIFDTKKFDVFSVAARNFAEIGMVKRSNEVFAEALTRLDTEMREDKSDAGLLFSMCNIGVEFDKSKIKADENLRSVLLNIIKNWEHDEY